MFSTFSIDVCVLPACVVIQRQAVGPAQISVNENLPVRTVQMSTLDLRNVTPIRPEQESEHDQWNALNYTTTFQTSHMKLFVKQAKTWNEIISLDV